MHYRLFVFAFLVLLVSAVKVTPVAAQKLARAIVATPSLSATQMPIVIAKKKGFYKEEGLDVDILVSRGSLAMKAMVGGSVDYTTAVGSTMDAAVKNLGPKVVFVTFPKPTFDFVGGKDIRSYKDLKGKLVGLSTRGGTVDQLTRLALTRNGLNPDKEVQLIVIGGQGIHQADIHRRIHADGSRRWNRGHAEEVEGGSGGCHGLHQRDPQRVPVL